jgi:hypothetical protein
MAKLRWEVQLGIGLTVLSAIVYLVHYAVFNDAHHIFIYLVGDIAFVPIEVLLVTVILHQLLERRERAQKLEKLNIVIGAFFSEVGTRLLACLSDADPQLEDIRSLLMIDSDWDDEEFGKAYAALGKYDYDIEITKIDLVRVRQSLATKREFMVRLLENPVLLEHESFTTLLQAVFHVTEELESRPSLEALPGTDLLHLRGDLRRAYTLLVGQWLDYMEHLKSNYPYLFSLAMRLNPFDQDGSPVVEH